MTSNNETVSHQNLCAGNTAKSMTSEGNTALLPANVDQRLPLQQGLGYFQCQNFQLYHKSLKRLVPQETVTYIHTLFTGSHYNPWRMIMRLSLYWDLSWQITHPAQERLATPPGSMSPTLFKQWCGFFYVPQEPDKWKCCETEPPVFCPYLRRQERGESLFADAITRIALSSGLSYSTTLRVGPAGVWTCDLLLSRPALSQLS